MEDYKKIIDDNNGIIYASELKKYKMNRHILRTLVESGILKRIEHGIYASFDKDINEFWLMGEKYKNGIYSHNTALYFYGMTDRTPLQLDMTFPSNNRVKNNFLNICDTSLSFGLFRNITHCANLLLGSFSSIFLAFGISIIYISKLSVTSKFLPIVKNGDGHAYFGIKNIE